MNPIKCIEFNKYLERCKKRTHLSYYDYQTILILASMQVSPYSVWQNNHDVTNDIYIPVENTPPIEEPIVKPINNIADLISVADQVKMLKLIKPELESINAMVGMQTIKTTLVNQILYYLQNMHVGGNDYRHIVITGPPGTGKTEIARLIGTMLSKIADKSKEPVFKKATRADLIAGYVGQTAIKTRALIEKCIDGVLFIDEAYSFGDDGFSKECADTLCESLSAYKDNLTVIIAGYEHQLNTQFFSLNPGLESRFSWRYNISGYNATELHDIFVQKVVKQGWQIENCVSWFQKHYKDFTGYGRDMDTLLFKVKIEHSRRVFSESATEKKLITIADLDAGFKVFMEHKKTNTNHIQKSMSLMYA
jgi:AAA+ superfamily predicted ATPase